MAKISIAKRNFQLHCHHMWSIVQQSTVVQHMTVQENQLTPTPLQILGWIPMYRPWKLELQRGKIVENSNVIILWPNIWTLLHLVSDSTQETKPFCCLNSDSVHLTNCILRISLPNLFYEFILQTLRETEASSLPCDPAFPADHVSWLHLPTMSQPDIPVVLISQPHCWPLSQQTPENSVISKIGKWMMQVYGLDCLATHLFDQHLLKTLTFKTLALFFPP